MDWIEESLKLLSIEQNCLPEPLTSINIQFLYINKENKLETTKKMDYKIADSCITKEEVLELVEKNKKKTNTTQYILKETHLFHITVNADNLGAFDEKSHNEYWISFPILDTIPIEDNVFVFHPFSTLYFMYFEEDKLAIKNMKRVVQHSKHHNVTKRVRWALNLPSKSSNRKNTRKQTDNT